MRPQTLILLAALAAGPASIDLHAAGDSKDDAPEYVALIHNYLKHSADYDYARLAGDMHPGALASFRRIVDRMLIRLVDRYGFNAVISIFDGVTNLRELDRLSDPDYWIFIMGTAGKFFEEEKWDGSLKVLSAVEEKGMLVVTCDATGTINPMNHWARPNRICTKIFRRHEEHWKFCGLHVTWVEKVFKMYLDSLPVETP